MARPYADEEEEKPLDPSVEKVRRKLVRFALVNLGILLVALMAVVGALVYKRGGAPEIAQQVVQGVVPTGEPVAGEILQPAGSEIVSQSLSGNRLSLDLRLSGGGRAILLYDLAEHRVVGRFDLRPE